MDTSRPIYWTPGLNDMWQVMSPDVQYIGRDGGCNSVLISNVNNSEYQFEYIISLLK